MVTFLLLAGMVPGSRNCLQVIDEIQEMRSPSSVSGLRFSLTMRLLAGNLRQELNSFSPASSDPATVVDPAPPAGAAGWAGSFRRSPRLGGTRGAPGGCGSGCGGFG